MAKCCMRENTKSHRSQEKWIWNTTHRLSYAFSLAPCVLNTFATHFGCECSHCFATCALNPIVGSKLNLLLFKFISYLPLHLFVEHFSYVLSQQQWKWNFTLLTSTCTETCCMQQYSYLAWVCCFCSIAVGCPFALDLERVCILP